MRWTDLLSVLRRRTTLVGVGFLAVGCGIVLNALWLQSGRHHPAPLFSTCASTLEPTPPRPDERVRALQAALREAGRYSGAVDGLSGPRTIAAITAFQRAHALPADGAASADLLAAIVAENRKVARLARPRPQPGIKADDDTAVAGGALPATDSESVAAVQRALSSAAYGPLDNDGVFGRETREAIRRFQADHGLPVTGEISDSLMVELRSAGALAGG